MAPRLVYDREAFVMPSPNHPHEEKGSAIDQLEARLIELKSSLETRRQWTPSEVEALEACIAVYRGMKAMGFLFGSIKQILIWIGVFAAGVIALRSGLLDWLGIGGNPK